MITDNYVWIVAGGLMQVPLIQKAKEMGYQVMVSDRNPKAPGSLLADEFIELDTYDLDGHMNVAQGLKIKPKAVLTAGADVGPTVSAVAELLGLPAERTDVAIHCRDKSYVRKTLKDKLNITHPVSIVIDWDEYSPASYWRSICVRADVNPYPCVVKPIDSSGSKGISLVKSPFGFARAVKLAQMYGRHKRSPILVEEYLDREMEVALDFFVEKGDLILANASKRIFYRKFGIEAGHINPWSPPGEVKYLARKAADALGVNFGPFKIDFLKDKKYGWVVMETATRLSGGFDHMTTGAMVGRDVTGTMLQVALGERVKQLSLRATKGVYACAFAPIDFRPGKIIGWGVPSLDDAEVFILDREQIRPLSDCSSRPVFVVAKGNSECSALKNAIRAARKISPVYE